MWDEPPPTDFGLGRHQLLTTRIFISLFWWLMLPSNNGRKMIVYIMKGYTEDE